MAHEFFAEWLSKAYTTLDDDCCRRRVEGADSLSATASARVTLTLVRLFLGKEVSASDLRAIRNRFQKFDSTFPMRGNDYEIQLLAGAVLAQILASERYDIATIAAMALRSSLGLIGEPSGIPEITGIVDAYLSTRSASIRAVKVLTSPLIRELDIHLRTLRKTNKSLDEATGSLRRETYTAAFDEMVEILAKVAEQYSLCIENDRVISEESNIHWWLTCESLRTVQTDLAAPNWLAIASGRELADLVRLYPGPRAAYNTLRHFIGRVGVEPDEVTSLVAAINGCDRSWRLEWESQWGTSTVLDLCPVLQGVKASLLVDQEHDWVPIYSKILGFDPPDLSTYQISELVYNECIFLAAFNTLEV